MSAIDFFKAGGRKRLAVLLLTCALAACSDEEAVRPAVISDAEAAEMLNHYACNACHEVDELRLGPSFHDIALRYADDPDTNEDRLVAKVIHGGAGSWGAVPMVSNPRMPEEDVRQIVHWIMSLEQSTP